MTIDEGAIFAGAVDVLLLGIALASHINDRRSAPGRAFAIALAMLGTNAIGYLWVRALGRSWPPAAHWIAFAMPADISMVMFAEWFLRVLRTVPVQDRWSRLAERLLRLCQITQIAYFLGSIVMADTLLRAFGVLPDTPPLESDWIFRTASSVGFSLPIVFFAVPMFMLLSRQPDLPERQRIAGVAAATPFFLVAEILPEGTDIEVWILLRLVGIVVALGGSLSYYMTQGQRSQFLSRFLSPGVGKLVGERGLMRALERTQLEITVLCCDLRGFTAFAEKRSSDDVVQLLSDYYNAVCAEVARVGGTVKDFAGDGILILVGAPVAQADHAQRGLELARAAREASRRAIAKWSMPETPLGIGVGVASGRVTVGVIDAAARLEYTAVGTTVNLAARLCGRAADGEVLISARTADLAGSAGLEPREPVALKGIGDAVTHFEMTEAAA